MLGEGIFAGTRRQIGQSEIMQKPGICYGPQVVRNAPSGHWLRSGQLSVSIQQSADVE
jgi:hypothetical protein